jgi:hypothetical protein
VAVSESEWRYLRELFPSLSRDERLKRNLYEQGQEDSGFPRDTRRRSRQALRELVNRMHPRGPRLATESFRDPFFEGQWYRAVASKPDLERNLSFDWSGPKNRDILWKGFFAPHREVPEYEREQYRELWRQRSGESRTPGAEDWDVSPEEFDEDLEPRHE